MTPTTDARCSLRLAGHPGNPRGPSHDIIARGFPWTRPAAIRIAHGSHIASWSSWRSPAVVPVFRASCCWYGVAWSWCSELQRCESIDPSSSVFLSCLIPTSGKLAGESISVAVAFLRISVPFFPPGLDAPEEVQLILGVLELTNRIRIQVQTGILFKTSRVNCILLI